MKPDLNTGMDLPASAGRGQRGILPCISIRACLTANQSDLGSLAGAQGKRNGISPTQTIPDRFL